MPQRKLYLPLCRLFCRFSMLWSTLLSGQTDWVRDIFSNAIRKERSWTWCSKLTSQITLSFSFIIDFKLLLCCWAITWPLDEVKNKMKVGKTRVRAVHLNSFNTQGKHFVRATKDLWCNHKQTHKAPSMCKPYTVSCTVWWIAAVIQTFSSSQFKMLNPWQMELKSHCPKCD